MAVGWVAGAVGGWAGAAAVGWGAGAVEGWGAEGLGVVVTGGWVRHPQPPLLRARWQLWPALAISRIAQEFTGAIARVKGPCYSKYTTHGLTARRPLWSGCKKDYSTGTGGGGSRTAANP